jgi:hypothetical protein
MTLLGTGNATPEKREGRVRLSPRSPLIENMLAGISIDDCDIEETRRFGNALMRARDAWADENRKKRRYSDAVSERAQNRLKWQTRGRV